MKALLTYITAPHYSMVELVGMLAIVGYFIVNVPVSPVTLFLIFALTVVLRITNSIISVVVHASK